MIALFAIPVAGLAVSDYVSSHRVWLTMLGLFTFSARQAGPLLWDLSAAAAALAFGLIGMLWVGGMFCGRNRRRLAIVFGPLIRLCCVLLAILALVQMAIAMVGGTVLALVTIHFVPVALLLAVMAGAFYAAKELAQAALAMSRPIEHCVMGHVVSAELQPELWDTLSRTASVLQARVPDHLVLGLAPGFFATAAKIRLLGSNTILAGETLYLSVSCLRILSERELCFVIGHELAHFAGEDTAYSLRFVPMYRGLLDALSIVHDGRRWRAISLFSARTIVRQGVVWFAKAERRISRSRELAADRAGARIAGPATALTALVHTAVAANLWPSHLQHVITEINQGAPPGNISTELAGRALALMRDADLPGLLDRLGHTSEPHPTDTHPSLSIRAEALGIPLTDLRVGPEVNAPTAWLLLRNAEALECRLGDDLRNRLIVDELAKPPSNPGRPNFVQRKRQQRRAQAEARQRRLGGELLG